MNKKRLCFEEEMIFDWRVKDIYVVNKVEVKLHRIWALREEMGVQKLQERKLFFSIGVSECSNIRSLCGGVLENEQEQVFREI